MDNSTILFTNYNKVAGVNRSRYRRSCTDSSSIEELVKFTKIYITEYSKIPPETARKLTTTLKVNEEKLFNIKIFKEIVECLYDLTSNIDNNGLTATIHYNLAVAIACHNKIEIDQIYLNNTKTQKAFKNFLQENYKSCEKYKKHHILNKFHLPKELWEVDNDTIQDIFSTNSDIFINYQWIS